jgi:hypothetical protein
MYQILATPHGPWLVADRQLSPDAFAHIARSLGTPILTARKIGRVAARRTEQAERIETRWNGRESEIDARPGDYVVTNLAPDNAVLRDDDGNANVYVVRAEKFPTLYGPPVGTNELGSIHPATTEVRALKLPGGFEIMAPWGELQRGERGYLLLNGNDVYGNNQEPFEETYEIIE